MRTLLLVLAIALACSACANVIQGSRIAELEQQAEGLKTALDTSLRWGQQARKQAATPVSCQGHVTQAQDHMPQATP